MMVASGLGQPFVYLLQQSLSDGILRTRLLETHNVKTLPMSLADET